MKISRTFHFEAAHILPFHGGKCQRLHGHSYRLELVFSGTPRPPHPDDPQSGFLADFGVISHLVKTELIDRHLDHFHLNQQLADLPYTSAEYLAAWIMRWAITHLEPRPELGGIRVVSARLWESPNSWAEAERTDAALLDPPA